VSRVLDLWKELLIVAPGLMLGWAAVRRAEALVIWAKRRSPKEKDGVASAAYGMDVEDVEGGAVHLDVGTDPLLDRIMLRRDGRDMTVQNSSAGQRHHYGLVDASRGLNDDP
jgi:hypothetical protein